MKYSIEGAPLPVVICDLEAGESMITEKGAMSWMTPNMKMETSGGGMGKMIGRMFSGENMIPEPLYSRRRSRTDCLCFQFSGVGFGI